MMSQSLPNLFAEPDIIYRILWHCDRQTISRCLRVNKQIYELGGPLLYRHVNLLQINSADGIAKRISRDPFTVYSPSDVTDQHVQNADKVVEEQEVSRYKRELIARTRSMDINLSFLDDRIQPDRNYLFPPKLEFLRIHLGGPECYAYDTKNSLIMKISAKDLVLVPPKGKEKIARGVDYYTPLSCSDLERFDRITYILRPDTPIDIRSHLLIPGHIEVVVVFETPSPKVPWSLNIGRDDWEGGDQEEAAEYLGYLLWQLCLPAVTGNTVRIVGSEKISRAVYAQLEEIAGYEHPDEGKGEKKDPSNLLYLVEVIPELMRDRNRPDLLLSKRGSGSVAFETLESYISGGQWNGVLDKQDIEEWFS